MNKMDGLIDGLLVMSTFGQTIEEEEDSAMVLNFPFHQSAVGLPIMKSEAVLIPQPPDIIILTLPNV